MTRATYIHSFVETFPDELGEGTLYVSVEYGSSAHRCFCGCGYEVYNKFSPHDWEMSFDGQNVSLWPSVGNWSFPCQSHYWITNGKIRHASTLSKETIESGRRADLKRRRKRLAKK